MRARLLALGLVVCGAARASVVVPDSTVHWKAIADRLFSTVVQVRGLEANATVSYGSGVLVGDGLAVTTLHAVAVPSGEKLVPVPQIAVLLPDGSQIEAQVIEASPELDLAMLSLPGSGRTLAAAPLAKSVPGEGDQLIAMGTGDDAIAVIGVIVSRVDGDLISLTSKRMIDSRFWGGPIFDDEGRLAGIQLSSVAGARAISARVIKGMIDRRALTRGPQEIR